MKSILPKYTVFGIILLGIIACERNKIETIEPLSYFPVFPGSYWKYIDSNDDTVIRATDPNYKEDTYIDHRAGPTRGPYLVPVYEGIPIWGYEEHTSNPTSYHQVGMRKILTLNAGTSWPIIVASDKGIHRKTVAIDSALIVLGKEYYPTIMVEEYWSSGPPEYVWIAKRFYTRDIGLVKEEILYYPDSIYSIWLFEYFINK